MATSSVPNPNFVAGTPAVADEVDANFAALVDFDNDSVVHRDGTKAMTAAFDAGSNKVVNLTPGTASTDAVNLGQLTAATSPLPLGVVGFVFRTVAQTAITTTTDLTSMTVTFTAAAGRRYRITGYVPFTHTSPGDSAGLFITTGSNGIIQTGYFDKSPSNLAVTGQVIAFVSPSAGSQTYKLRANAQAGGPVATTASASSPAYIVVEDIGLA